MKRRPTPPPYELFHFAVGRWWLEYSLHLNREYRAADPLGRCWEHHLLKLAGPLQSKTRRRIERVELWVDPDGRDPSSWKEEWKGFGWIQPVRRGTLTARISLPARSFSSLLVAVAANNIREAYIVVDDMVGRSGGAITTFSTGNPTGDAASEGHSSQG